MELDDKVPNESDTMDENEKLDARKIIAPLLKFIPAHEVKEKVQILKSLIRLILEADRLHESEDNRYEGRIRINEFFGHRSRFKDELNLDFIYAMPGLFAEFPAPQRLQVMKMLMQSEKSDLTVENIVAMQKVIKIVSVESRLPVLNDLIRLKKEDLTIKNAEYLNTIFLHEKNNPHYLARYEKGIIGGLKLYKTKNVGHFLEKMAAFCVLNVDHRYTTGEISGRIHFLEEQAPGATHEDQKLLLPLLYEENFMNTVSSIKFFVALGANEKTPQTVAYLNTILWVMGPDYHNDVVTKALSLIGSLDHSIRGKVLQLVASMFRGIGIDQDYIIRLVTYLSMFTPEKIELEGLENISKSAALAMHLLKTFSGDELSKHCKTLHSLSLPDLESISGVGNFFRTSKGFANLQSLYHRDSVQDSLYKAALNALESEEGRLYIRELYEGLKDESPEAFQHQIKAFLKQTMCLTPERCLKVFHHFMCNMQMDLREINPGPQIINTAIYFTPYNDESRAYLDAEFDKILHGVGRQDEWPRIYELAHKVAFHFEGAGIDDPLWTKAIEAYAITSANKVDNSRNPYYIFGKLKQLSQTEKPVELESTQQVTVKAGENDPGETINVNLSLAKIRKLIKIQSYTLKNLPKGIKPDCFLQLFADLQARLAVGDMAKANEEVSSLTENVTLDKLKEEVFGKPEAPTEVVKYLNLQHAESNTPVPPFAMYLHTIMQYLLDLKKQVTQVQEGNALLPHEQQFLLLSSMISKCVTGKRDGIAAYYNSDFLPEKYRLKTVASSNLENRFEAFVSKSLEPIFENIILEEAVVKSCIPQFQGKIPQMSHHSGLVGNRFRHQFGYKFPEGTYAYDAHTHVLLKEFVEKLLKEITDTEGMDAKAVLEAIFKEYTVRKMVDRIKMSFASMFLNKDLPQLNLPAFLEGKGKVLSPAETFVLDEYSMPSEITDKAALAILEALGEPKASPIP